MAYSFGLDVKAALHAAIKTLFAGPFDGGLSVGDEPEDVLVHWGLPTREQLTRDFVSVLGVRTEQSSAALGPQHQRDEIIEVEVLVSSAGGDTDEQLTATRAMAIAGAIEDQVRTLNVTHPALGVAGLRECFLTRTEISGSTDETVVKRGRCTDVTMTFRAVGRITS